MGLYSKDHIIFLAIFFVLLILTIILVKFVFKTQKQKDIFVRCVGGFLLAWIVANRISLAVWMKDALQLIPNTYCGMTSFLISIFALIGKPHDKMFDFLIYVEIFGGLAAIFYPTFLTQGPSFWFFPTLSGMAHHAVGSILCLVLIMSKWFEPSLKRWYMLPLGLCAYTIFGLFLLDVLHIKETMYIDLPILPGTFLKWWFFIIVGSLVAIFIEFIYEKCKTAIDRKSVV